MVVDTDDMAKVTELMRPMLGRWTSKVTPIANINPRPWRHNWLAGCNGAKVPKVPRLKGLSCFRDTPHQEATGDGVLKKVGRA